MYRSLGKRIFHNLNLISLFLLRIFRLSEWASTKLPAPKTSVHKKNEIIQEHWGETFETVPNTNYVIDKKYRIKDFSENLKKILKSKTHIFKIDGNYLMDIGMEQGALMGKVLKKIEEEWIKNNFKITKDEIKKIIKSSSN